MLKTASNKARKFKLGCDFKSPMQWDDSWDISTKREYQYKHWKNRQAHPDWTMDKKETYFRQQLAEFVKKRKGRK